MTNPTTATPTEIIVDRLTSTIYGLCDSVREEQLRAMSDTTMRPDVRLSLVQEYDRLYMALARRASELHRRSAVTK